MKPPNNTIYSIEGPFGYQEMPEVDFRRIVLQEGRPALVTFSGDWMGSATMLHLIMEDLWAEFKDKTHFFCVNLEKSKLAKEFGITHVATICFFCKGELVDQQIGLVSKNKLRSKVAAFIAKLAA